MANIYYTDFKAKQVINKKEDPPPPKAEFVTLRECFMKAKRTFPFVVEYALHTGQSWPVKIVGRSNGMWRDEGGGLYGGHGPRWRFVR